MYTGASTRLRILGRKTEPVPFRCGTIQGDVLSPVLFNIFLNTLLRWLDIGSAGYVPGSIVAKLAACGYRRCGAARKEPG